MSAERLSKSHASANHFLSIENSRDRAASARSWQQRATESYRSRKLVFGFRNRPWADFQNPDRVRRPGPIGPGV